MQNLEPIFNRFYFLAKPKSRIFVFHFIVAILFNNAVGAQKMETWIMGVQYSDYDSSSWKFSDTTSFNNNHNHLRGGSILSFKNNLLSTTRHKNTLNLFLNIVNICDSNGNLLFYCNGSKIFTKNHLLMQNGDSLNYSKYWEIDTPDSRLYFYSSIVDVFPQNTIAIPNPYNKDQYYLISTYYAWGSTSSDYRAFTRIMYSIIDMSFNNGLGKVIVKEKVLTTGNFAQGVFATKKSNGIDWWLLVRNLDSTGCFTKMSIDSKGIYLNTGKDCLGYKVYSKVNFDSIFHVTGGNFSPDGNHFSFLSYKGVELFDFDRCTGKLSNSRVHDYPLNDTNYHQYKESTIIHPIFSPNSNLLYVIYNNRVYQYEVNSTDFPTSQVRVATYDGFVDRYEPDTMYVGWYTSFSTAQLAPNNKIYIGTEEDTRYLHEIEFPDKKGKACNLKQHSVMLPTFKRGVPYYPNYNLGAEFCCDYGSSISANDTSLWTLDTGTYQWLYCDSNNKPIPNATQGIYKPKKSGNYAVRISNSLCTDTTDCKYIQVRSGISDVSMAVIEIYPNPVSDKLHIESYSKRRYDYEILDLLGRTLIHGQASNEINLSPFGEGIYLLKLSNENLESKTFKLEIRR